MATVGEYLSTLYQAQELSDDLRRFFDDEDNFIPSARQLAVVPGIDLGSYASDAAELLEIANGRLEVLSGAENNSDPALAKEGLEGLLGHVGETLRQLQHVKQILISNQKVLENMTEAQGRFLGRYSPSQILAGVGKNLTPGEIAAIANDPDYQAALAAIDPMVKHLNSLSAQMRLAQANGPSIEFQASLEEFELRSQALAQRYLALTDFPTNLYSQGGNPNQDFFEGLTGRGAADIKNALVEYYRNSVNLSEQFEQDWLLLRSRMEEQ